MPFNTLRNKIKNIYNDIQDNFNHLSLNKNTVKILNTKNNFIKNGKIIYDSDWLDVSLFDSGTIINIDTNKYAYIFNDYSVEDGSVVGGTLFPFNVQFGLKQKIEIPETWIPYAEVKIITKSVPNYVFYGAKKSDVNVWDNVNHFYRIKGNSTLIYQGFSPAQQKIPETEIDDGNILASLTSKWYYGTVQYSISGTPYSHTGYINGVTTYYNLSYNSEAEEYDYKCFSTGAIDSISSGNVTGKGTYIVATWIDAGGGNYYKQEVVTKNVTKSAPLREDYTILSLVNPSVAISFQGILGGNAILNSWDFSYNNQVKLWYSSSKATQFDFDTDTEELDNLPLATYYQSGSVPYSNLTVEVNPDDYPLSTTTNDYNFINTSNTWAKINEKEFLCYFIGKMIVGIPATVVSDQELIYIDENYSASGSTYVKDGDNRPGKEKQVYLAKPQSFKIKFQIVLDKEISSIKNFSYKL